MRREDRDSLYYFVKNKVDGLNKSVEIFERSRKVSLLNKGLKYYQKALLFKYIIKQD